MSDSDKPELKVPLGLRPSLRPTYDSLLRRSRRRLQLLHSGQDKLEYLTDEQYLRGARRRACLGRLASGSSWNSLIATCAGAYCGTGETTTRVVKYTDTCRQ